MQYLVDIGKISKGIVGFADLIGRLAKNIEEAMTSGFRSADKWRKARERKRMRNFMRLTAELYMTQNALVSRLSDFCETPDPSRWTEVRSDVLDIGLIVGRIEKYILPYSDFLTVQHRGEYLTVLRSLKDRRKILGYLSEIDYQDARKVLGDLKAMANAYDKLMSELRDISLNLGGFLADDEELWRKMCGAKRFERLVVPPKAKRKALENGRPRKRAAASSEQTSSSVSPARQTKRRVKRGR